MSLKENGDIVEFLKQKDYEMVNNNLGLGSFGKTVLLNDPFIDELFVAKKYEPYLEEDQKEFYESFLQEIKIMYKLNHKNVVRIFNYYPYEKIYTGYIIMEYIDGYTIDEYLDKYTPWGDYGDPDSLFAQLIDGFEYIEKQGIIHRDIREGNILVTKDGTVKIIDFGLGKTFAPVDTSKDSMVEIINRSGLDCLPNEYFEGKYDSQTDMFYLAELFNRHLVKSGNDIIFSYEAILHKMMEPQKENRYADFSAIKEAMNSRDFSTIEINQQDKKIYQSFTNAIVSCMSCFTEDKAFTKSVADFTEKLKNLIKKNCFEDYIQGNGDIVGLLVTSNCKYFPKDNIECTVFTDFETWFSGLSEDAKKLVFNNMIAKISLVETRKEYDDLPF